MINETDIKRIWFRDRKIYLETVSGEVGYHPLSWFPKLDSADSAALEQYTLSPFGIHWPELDEDLSFEGFFNYKAPKKSVVK